MKNNDDIPTTDTNEIKQLISRVKQGELDQGDAQLIEKLGKSHARPAHKRISLDPGGPRRNSGYPTLSVAKTRFICVSTT